MSMSSKIKKFLLFGALVGCFGKDGKSQIAIYVISGPNLPANCSILQGQIYFKTTGGVGVEGLYQCGPTDNNWTYVGTGGGGNVSNSGTPLLHQGMIWASATTAKGISTFTVDDSGNMAANTMTDAGEIVTGTAATDAAALGSEVTTSGTCSGTGWTGTYPNYVAPGTTAALTCTGFTSGSYYQTVTTIGAGGSGAVTVAIGTAQLASATSGTLTAGLKANGTSLTFTPAATYTGTIGISAKLITPISKFALTTRDSGGNTSVAITQQLAANSNLYIGAGLTGSYNTTGTANTGFGIGSLAANTTGSGNVASGYQALYSNTTVGGNVASGYQALYSNTTGGFNVASGYQALYSNTAGSSNVANGNSALYTCGQSGATCTRNIALGYNAGRYYTGAAALNSASYGIYIGSGAGASANSNTNEIYLCSSSGNTYGQGTNTAALGCAATTDVYAGSAGAAVTHTAGLINGGTVYSVAGTPLPTCNAGSLLKILPSSDITTLHAAYVGSGTFTGWVECTYNTTGTVYAWSAM